MIVLSKFAENLKDLIFDGKLSQKELADRTGVDEASISRYLKGNCMPNLKSIIALAEFFNCSVDFLMGCTQEKSNTEFLPCPPVCVRLQYYLGVYGKSGYSLCKKVGLPDNKFYGWLNGANYPTIENVEKIAKYFNCSIDKFLGREN